MDEGKLFIALEDIHIATPCHAAWDKMAGTEQARFCQTCAKHVYNLSEMSRSEAEALLSANAELPCVKFYQRADGMIITDDCPVGIWMVRRPVRWLSGIATAVVAACLGVIGGKGGATSAQANDAPPAPTKSHKTKPPKIMPLQGIVAPRPRPTPGPQVKPTPGRLLGKPVRRLITKTMGEPMMGGPVAAPPKPAPLPSVIHPGKASQQPHILHPKTAPVEKDK